MVRSFRRAGRGLCRRALLLAVMLAAAAAARAEPASGPRIADQTREVFLSNGMKLLLSQRQGQPNVAAGWVARVGSANERPGITGMSHLFEHMMFKGSPRIGTRDFELDRQLRTELDEVRAAMFAEERALRERVRLGFAESLAEAAARSENMTRLRERFDALLAAQRDNLVKDEFDRIYTEAGATNLNAFTNQDMTVYFVQVPRNKLELWFWMESERLFRPVFREFYAERDVVFEERRLRTDSTPTGAQDEVFNALFWRGHPYAWPVVGWPSDIAAISRGEAQTYFDLYYAPANITLALVGDFDEQQALDWAEAYFGRIPRGREAPPDVITTAMPQLGDLVYEAAVQAPPSAAVWWRTTAFAGRDDPALQVLGSVLSGRTGRLHKRMVLGDRIATGAGAEADSAKYDGRFGVFAEGKQGIDPRRLADVLIEEVERVKAEGITAYELEKVKNQLTASQFRRLEDPFFLMVQLLFFDGLREWRTMDSYYERVFAVQARDVQAVATKYLTEDNRATRLYTRRAEAAGDPELAAFDPETRAQIERMLEQIEGLAAEGLLETRGQLESLREQAPEEMRAAVDYVLDEVRRRLAENTGAEP